MQPENKQFGTRGKWWLSLLLIALILFSAAAASSTPLHRVFHPDADSPQHSCFITSLSQGQIVGQLFAQLFLLFVPLLVLALVLREKILLLKNFFNFSDSRAPPVFSFPFAIL